MAKMEEKYTEKLFSQYSKLRRSKHASMKKLNHNKAVLGALSIMLVFTVGGVGQTLASADPLAQEQLTTPSAISDPIDKTEKSEIVYAKMSNVGAIESVYVVNHFSSANSGEIIDYGAYDSVSNLTNSSELKKTGDSVSFKVEKDDFYYQGNLATKNLPWIFEVSYSLDGKKIAPADLAGASGKLEITLSSRANKVIEQTFYDNYMLQITVTLDAESAKNIDAPGATIAEAGKSKAVTYTVMPGKDGNHKLKANVSNFSMAGIQIAGIPFAMEIEMPDIEGQFSELNQLPEAISSLNEGVGKLVSGTEQLKFGSKQLVGGSVSIQEGLTLLDQNSSQLTKASKTIKDALRQISGALADSSLDEIDLSQLTQLPDALRQLGTGLDGMSAGLVQLKDGYLQSYATLDGAMADIPEGTLTEDDIAALMAAVPVDQQPTASQLAANYEAAQTAKRTYLYVKPGFDAVASTIDNSLIPGLGEMSTTLETIASGIEDSLENFSDLSQLEQLFAGLEILSANYGSFHSGLKSYTDGVSILEENYGAFHGGLNSFNGGVDSLNSGVGELYSGTNLLNDEVSTLPDVMKEEIDKMKEKFLPADFETVSFTSSKNTSTAYVQFVIQGDSIELPKQDAGASNEEVKETFWTRLKALFGL